ncbi:MAG: GNAT family N-acetyltransferase [Ginsengibacter sp.]
MENVKLILNKKGNGLFYINDNHERIGKMVIGISGNELTIYHTEVLPKYEGKGLAKALFNAMVKYAREKKLKVIPLCTYVLAQFEKHSDEYRNIWKSE